MPLKSPARKTNNILLIIGILLLSCTISAQDYPVYFVSTDASEWEIDGRVSTQMIDSTLAFIFSFDEANPPQVRPDTVYLDLATPIDLSSCDSVFIRYSTIDNLPSSDSWVAGDVEVLVRHPNNMQWIEIYDENLSHLGGWVNSLDLRLKVAVRSNPSAPGEFRLFNVRFEGKCTP